MKLCVKSVEGERERWEKIGVKTPGFDVEGVAKRTRERPLWLHFGAGNIFRGFIAVLQQRLIERGEADGGIVAAESFDGEIIGRIYEPFDNLTLNVTLNSDGTTAREITASVAEALLADGSGAGDRSRLFAIAESPSLQIISYTITEKGYAVFLPDGSPVPSAQRDMASAPEGARHAMGITAALLWRRFKAGAWPVALVSMDNCSRNGEKLRSGVLAIAERWLNNGFVGRDFIEYISDKARVAFPWTMIDRITPRPHDKVREGLAELGIEGMAPIVTSKGTYIAPFVNSERPQYLVIEDCFPNGRPPLERAGVYMTDRETVMRCERMKVTACLNPLHTAMSVYGCMLGYGLICEEMKDPDIVALIRRLGYVEGLPVAANPGILDPRAFLDEVVTERLPNPFMPDAPQRIATDTSQKVGIRFGETVKSYLARGMDLRGLVAIPLALAGWMRYLLAADDELRPMPVSDDPMREELQRELSGVVPGRPETYGGQLRPIFAREGIFGLDIAATPLFERVERYFVAELNGPGAVRKTLHDALTKEE